MSYLRNRNKLREQTYGCRGRRGGIWGRDSEGFERHKLLVTKQMSHGYEMHSVENKTSNYVVSLDGDR